MYAAAGQLICPVVLKLATANTLHTGTDDHHKKARAGSASRLYFHAAHAQTTNHAPTRKAACSPANVSGPSHRIPLSLVPTACVPTCLNVTQLFTAFHRRTGSTPAKLPSTNSQNPGRFNSSRR